MSVAFAPEVATDRLVFRLWPNSHYYARRGALPTVGPVNEGGRALPTSRPDPTTLVVRRALSARERVVVSTTWKLRLPSTPGTQLHGGRGARLVSFFPLLAWDGSAWALDPPVPLDSLWPTSPTADFDVRVVVPKGSACSRRASRAAADGGTLVPPVTSRSRSDASRRWRRRSPHLVAFA